VWPQLLATASVLLAYAAYVRWIEKRALVEFSRNGALRELGAGCAVGAGAVAAAVGALYAAGAWHPAGLNPWSLAIAIPIAEMMFVGVLEEVLFRAILFRILDQWLGGRVALLLSAALFGLAHVPGEGATLLAIANTVVAGVMFAAAYRLTRRLWLCIGIHAAWNYTLGSIFSIAVSGHQSRAGLVDGTLTGPDWLTGGAYGLEGSVVTLVLLIGLSAAFLRPRKARS
jgi:membrane protease YdiL (CAAX protease family)